MCDWYKSDATCRDGSIDVTQYIVEYKNDTTISCDFSAETVYICDDCLEKEWELEDELLNKESAPKMNFEQFVIGSKLTSWCQGLRIDWKKFLFCIFRLWLRVNVLWQQIHEEMYVKSLKRGSATMNNAALAVKIRQLRTEYNRDRFT